VKRDFQERSPTLHFVQKKTLYCFGAFIGAMVFANNSPNPSRCNLFCIEFGMGAFVGFFANRHQLPG
jgi:hypothetical protein